MPSSHRHVEFGLFIRHQVNYPSILKLAQEAEKAGFLIVYVNDHLIDPQNEKRDILESFTLMTAIGVLTNLRVGHVVLCNSFRNPALLAKMGATLDVITNGRFELGIGAGWNKREYLAYGYSFPSHKVRVNQLRESLHIIKRLWTEDEVTFKGKYFSLERCINLPKPVQKPHPPIMVGGIGDDILKVAAEFADEINLLRAGAMPLERIKERINFVYSYCEKIDRDPAEIKFSINRNIVIAEDEEQLKSFLEQIQPEWQQREEFLTSAFIGTPESITHQIQNYIDIGISKFIFVVYDPTSKRLNLISKIVKSL